MDTAREALAQAMPAVYDLDISASRMLTPWLAAAVVVDKADEGIRKVIKYLFVGIPDSPDAEGRVVDDVQAGFGLVVGPHFQDEYDLKQRLAYERIRLEGLANLFRTLMRRRTSWRFCQHRDVVTAILKDIRALRLDFNGREGGVVACDEERFFRFDNRGGGRGGFHVGRRQELDAFRPEHLSPLSSFSTAPRRVSTLEEFQTNYLNFVATTASSATGGYVNTGS